MKPSAMLSAIAVAVAAFAGVAYAVEPLDDGANYNKPGRQIDDNILTSRQAYERASREIDDTIVSGRRINPQERDIDDGMLKQSHVVHHEKAKKKIRKKPLEE